MTQLTQEFFEEQIQKLATKEDLQGLATKVALEKQTEELKAYADQQTDGLNPYYETIS